LSNELADEVEERQEEEQHVACSLVLELEPGRDGEE